MKHILLQFAETPEGADISTDCIEYDHTLHLNVVKNTAVPAVTFDQQATETFTKAHGEGADSERNSMEDIYKLMSTSTETRIVREASDSDPRQMLSLLYTMTQTHVEAESSDSDKGIKDQLM